MDRKTSAEVLNQALRYGADFAEVYREHRETSALSFEDQRIERIKSGIDEGVGIRVISGEQTSYAHTNDLSLESLLEVAGLAGRAVLKQQTPYREFNFYTPQPVAELEIEMPPEEFDIDSKVAKIRMANEAARQVDHRIRQVSVGYADVRQYVTIANSNGVYVEDLRTRTRLSINAVASEQGIIQTGYQSAGGTVGFELFQKEDPAEMGKKAAERAIMMLSAQAAPSGKMPVVLAGSAGGTMVHEACGHGLEADLVQKGLSVYAGKKGQRVASPLVTVVDDGTIPGKFGSIRYDDEGFPSQKTVLIKDGVLEEYLYDYETSQKEGRASTGNGRRESYQSRPLPRMRNTYIASGSWEPEKIIREAGNALLVTAMGGGQVNTATGDYVFDVAEGYLLEDGQVVCPVRGATLTGNGPETLGLVEMVGNDLGYTIGVCGKGGQGVPVSDAQPTMYIKELTVGGTADIPSHKPRIRRL